MPRKQKTVPTARIPDIQAALKKKAAAPKTITVSELVRSLAQPIQEMLDAGYSYSDVSDVFKGHGVELAASGIKSFHLKAIPQNTTDTESAVDLVESAPSTATDSSTLTVDEKPSSFGSAMPSLAEDAIPITDVKKSSSRTTKTQKQPLSTAQTNSQFNVTDRSNV